MMLPTEPVTLSLEQIGDLNQQLTTLRHDVNNNLSLMMAAVEMIRRRPESSERMWETLNEQPQKIINTISQFSVALEATLRITRP